MSQTIPAGFGLPTTMCFAEVPEDHQLLAMIASASETIAQGGGGGGGLSNIPIGNTLFVDAVNGNDSTGARGQLAKPFLTLTAAVAAMQSGDCVYVWPGTYSDATVTRFDIPLAFYFTNGSVWDTGDPFINCISDTNGAQTVTIDGYGRFFGGAGNNYPGNGTFNIQNAASIYRIRGDHVESLGTGGSAGGSYGEFTFNDIGLVANGTRTTWPALWWDSGNTYIYCKNFVSGGGDYPCIDLTGSAATDNLYIEADYATQTGNYWMQMNSASNLARVWIKVKFLDGGGFNLNPNDPGAVIYVITQKCKMPIVIGGNTGEFHLFAQKLDCNVTIGGGTGTTGLHVFEIGDIEDEDAGGSTIFSVTASGKTSINFLTSYLTQSGTSLFTNSGGNFQIFGGDFTMIAGQVGSIASGGTTRVGCRIDASAVAGVSPLNIQTAGTPVVILEPSAKLLSNGATNSIVRDSGSVTVIGQGYANNAAGTGVTAAHLTVIAGLL